MSIQDQPVYNTCLTCIRGPEETCIRADKCLIGEVYTYYLPMANKHSQLELITIGEKEERLKEDRMDIIGQNGNEGLHYQEKISDGSTASYYEFPVGAKELQDLISFRNMNAQLGEIFRASYRYGQCPHSPKLRDIKKIIFYALAELNRLENLENRTLPSPSQKGINLHD